MSDGPRSRLAGVVRFALAYQLNTVVTLATGLVATPVLLAWLGPERFGLVRVIEAWQAYLGVGGPCVTLAAGTGLVTRLAAGDPAAVGRFVSAAGVFALGVAGITVVVGLGLLPFLPTLVAAPPHLETEVAAAFAVAVAGFLLGPLAVSRVLFEADQQGYRVSLVLTLAAVVTTAANLVAAGLGWGLPGQAAAGLFALAFQSGVLAAWARRSYPQYPLGRPARADVREIARLAGQLLATGLFGVVAARVEVLAANGLAGPEGVTRYFLTQRLFSLWQGQTAGLCGALWAPFGDLFHRGEHAALRARVVTGLNLVVGLSLAAAVPFVGYEVHFLTLWRVGAEQYAGLPAAVAFGVALPLIAVQNLQGWLIAGTGFVRDMIPNSAAFALAAVGGCVGLGEAWGLPGVAAGIAVANLVLVAANARVAARRHGVPAAAVVGALARGFAVAVPLGAAAVWAGGGRGPFGWAGLVAEMGAFFWVYLAGWWLLLPAAERAGLRNILSRLRRKPA